MDGKGEDNFFSSSSHSTTSRNEPGQSSQGGRRNTRPTNFTTTSAKRRAVEHRRAEAQQRLLNQRRKQLQEQSNDHSTHTRSIIGKTLLPSMNTISLRTLDSRHHSPAEYDDDVGSGRDVSTDMDDDEEEAHEEKTVTPTNWLLTGTPVPGGPTVTTLIPSFGGHIALSVWQGVERRPLSFKSRAGLLASWSLSDLRHEVARDIVGLSGLAHLWDISHRHFDMSMISAFVERWQPDTNSFHMPFGEMTITLHDVYHILKIPISGQIVSYTPEVVDRRHQRRALSLEVVLPHILELFGGNITKEEMKACKYLAKSKITFRALRDHCGGPNCFPIQEARAYLWYLIGNTILIDKGNDRIMPTSYWPLHNVQRVSHYAWGTATLAYLYRQLGIASRSETRSISGCLTLLQCWIYEYFPMFRVHHEKWDSNVAAAARWEQLPKSRSSMDRQTMIRGRIDIMTSNEVNWTPFGHEGTMIDNKKSHWYGTIQYLDVIEPYMPDRCLRQFGYRQTVPMEPIRPNSAYRPHNGKKYIANYETCMHYWNNVDIITRGQPLPCEEDQPYQVTPGYYDWFAARSHLRIRPPHDLPRISIVEQISYWNQVQATWAKWIGPDRPHGFPHQMDEDFTSQFLADVEELVSLLRLGATVDLSTIRGGGDKGGGGAS